MTAEFVAGKIYRFFVREDLSPAPRAALGTHVRESGYQLKPLLTQMFLSRDFYSAPSVATQIKSPVHLVVSTYRKMGLREVPTIPDFGRMTGSLGQTLFDPPNVAGWAGGRTWITPSTLLQRGNLLRDVLFPDVEGFRPPDRTLSATDRAVGERLARGHGHHRGDARKRRDAEHDGRVEHDGRARRGLQHALRRLQGLPDGLRAHEAIPRRPAAIDLTAMIAAAARADTADEVVDHFARRFLSVPLADRIASAGRLPAREGRLDAPRAGATLEAALRELLYLVLSYRRPARMLGASRGARTMRTGLERSHGSAAAFTPATFPRDFRGGLYGIGVGAGLPLRLEPHVGSARGAGARGHERREASRADPRRRRAVGRQRRLEHRRAVRRPCVLSRAAEAGHPGA